MYGKKGKTNNRNNQKGVAVVMLVVLLPAMILLVGLTIDIGLFWHQEFRLQMAVRNAAYSGASEILKQERAGNGFQRADGENEAKKNFRKNFPGVSPQVYVSQKSVRVVASTSVQQYFMPIVQLPSRQSLKKDYKVNIK